MDKLLPPNKSSIITQKQAGLLKSDKFFARNTKTKTTKVNVATKESPKLLGDTLTKIEKKDIKIDKLLEEDTLTKIEKKVIKIDKLLKDSLLFSKKENEKKRVSKEKESFERKEKDLEKKKPKSVKGVKLPTTPKMSFLDRIKNFIIQTILGFIAVRLVEHLPKLLSLLPTIIKVTDFITDLGGKLLDGLVTFVDWGYKAIDGTRQFAKQLGGEGLAQNFDKFAGAIDNVLEIAIIAALATADSGGGGDLVGDFFKKRAAPQVAKTAGQQAAGAAGRTAGIGAGAAAAIVAGAGLLASALGEGAFQIRKVAVEPIQNLEKEYKSDKNPFTKIGRGIVLNMVRPLYGVFSTVGFLLDVVGAPFRYAIELLRYPFLSDEDKVKQAKNLAKFDARIREDLRKALNMLTLGFAFKEKGSFGNIYGNKDAQKEMMSKMAGGGQPATRGGKPVTGPTKRTLKKKKKAPRTLRATPSKLKPGGAVGGEKQIKKLYPESKDKTKMSPFDFLKNSYDAFSKTTGLGALVALAIKPLMGDKPSYADYKNVGVGINNWMNSTISSSGTMAYAGGGEVKMESIVSGQDYSDVIAKSVQESVAPEVDKTIQDLMRQLMLKEPEKTKKDAQEAPSPDDMGEGAGVQVSSDSEDFWLLATAAMFENSNPQGAADVAQVIYNRTQYPAWNAPSIRKAILNPNQFQPVRQYGGTAAWAAIKTKSDALRFAKSHGKTQEQLERVAAALLDKQKQQDARSFVGPRDSFRAESYEKANNHLANETEKTRHGHTFGFEPGGAMIGQFKAGKLSAAQVNANIVGNVNLKAGDGRFIQGNSGRSEGTHFHIGTNKPGDGSGVAAAGFNVIKNFLGKKSVYVGRSKETIPANATDEQIRGYIRRGQIAHATRGRGPTELDLQIGGTGAGNKVAFPLALKGMKYSSTDGYGVSADIVGTNAFVGHGRYKPDGTLAPQQGGTQLLAGAPDFYAFHGMNKVMTKGGLLKFHKGEYISVTDADSFKLVGNILTDINSIENKSQLVARAPSIIEKLKSISGYTEYENPESEIQYVEVPVEVPVPMPVTMGGGFIGGGGVNSNDSFDRLAIG